MKIIFQISTMMQETQLDTKNCQIMTMFCVHHNMQTPYPSNENKLIWFVIFIYNLSHFVLWRVIWNKIHLSAKEHVMCENVRWPYLTKIIVFNLLFLG
jgi:hypothetical protein